MVVNAHSGMTCEGLTWNIDFPHTLTSPIINSFFNAVIIKDQIVVCEYFLKGTNEVFFVYGNFFVDLPKNDSWQYEANNSLLCMRAIDNCNFIVPQPIYANLKWSDACNQCWPSPQTAINNSCTDKNCVAQGYYHCLSQNPPLQKDDPRISNLINAGFCQYLGNKWIHTPTLPLSSPANTKQSNMKAYKIQLNFYNKAFHSNAGDLQQMKADIVKRFKDYHANLRKCIRVLINMLL